MRTRPYIDAGQLRVNNAETHAAWSHNFVEGWNDGADEDDNDFQVVSKSADGAGDLIRLVEAGAHPADVIGWSSDDEWVYVQRRDIDEDGSTCNSCQLLKVAADGSGEVEILQEGDFYTNWLTVF